MDKVIKKVEVGALRRILNRASSRVSIEISIKEQVMYIDLTIASMFQAFILSMHQYQNNVCKEALATKVL